MITFLIISEIRDEIKGINDLMSSLVIFVLFACTSDGVTFLLMFFFTFRLWEFSFENQHLMAI